MLTAILRHKWPIESDGTKRITLIASAMPGKSEDKHDRDHLRRTTASPDSWAVAQGVVPMAGQVVLYFEDQADALRFALAAGSVMAGEGGKVTNNLVEETARVTRIRLDAVAGPLKKSASGRVA